MTVGVSVGDDTLRGTRAAHCQIVHHPTTSAGPPDERPNLALYLYDATVQPVKHAKRHKLNDKMPSTRILLQQSL